MLVPGSTLDTKNPWLFQPHGWPYISVFLYPWIQPMAYHVVLKPFMEKKKTTNNVSVDAHGSNTCYSKIYINLLLCNTKD